MSGKRSRNPWTLSAKGGAGDDTSVFAPAATTRSPERDDAGEQIEPLCASCEQNVADCSKPCEICGELSCNACMMRCSFCSYQICSGCIECQCYSDGNWVEAVKRKTDGKEFKICVGPFGCCLEKPEHKDAYESDRADSDRPDSEASSEERSDSESDGAKRKAAKRELADLLS